MGQKHFSTLLLKAVFSAEWQKQSFLNKQNELFIMITEIYFWFTFVSNRADIKYCLLDFVFTLQIDLILLLYRGKPFRMFKFFDKRWEILPDYTRYLMWYPQSTALKLGTIFWMRVMQQHHLTVFILVILSKKNHHTISYNLYYLKQCFIKHHLFF